MEVMTFLKLSVVVSIAGMGVLLTACDYRNEPDTVCALYSGYPVPMLEVEILLISGDKTRVRATMRNVGREPVSIAESSLSPIVVAYDPTTVRELPGPQLIRDRFGFRDLEPGQVIVEDKVLSDFYPRLADAETDAILEWRFAPSTHDGSIFVLRDRHRLSEGCSEDDEIDKEIGGLEGHTFVFGWIARMTARGDLALGDGKAAVRVRCNRGVSRGRQAGLPPTARRLG